MGSPKGSVQESFLPQDFSLSLYPDEGSSKTNHSSSEAGGLPGGGRGGMLAPACSPMWPQSHPPPRRGPLVLPPQLIQDFKLLKGNGPPWKGWGTWDVASWPHKGQTLPGHGLLRTGSSPTTGLCHLQATAATSQGSTMVTGSKLLLI